MPAATFPLPRLGLGLGPRPGPKAVPHFRSAVDEDQARASAGRRAFGVSRAGADSGRISMPTIITAPANN